MTARLSRILIYPIKALDPWDVPEVPIAPGGSLAFDRRWAIVDERIDPVRVAQGKANPWVNGKREPKIHRLRSRFEPGQGTHQPDRVTLGWDHLDKGQTFELVPGRSALTDWLSNGLGYPVAIAENTDRGFPDDPVSPGPTLISEASLATVTQWFPGQSLAQMRGRFRVNLEISGVPAFWEDRLFGEEGSVTPFQLGSVQVLGINPCKRCVVPTRDPATGEVWAQFQRQFNQQRRLTLPDWTVADRFQNPYRLSINTRIPATEAGKVLRVGDRVSVETGGV
ncbi:MAG: MOSC domain-containing protein [Prochlorothrix sp.]|nr:MOSC N-terminal beta barrel domain-containing protein [Prochlorothrix sp.]